MDKIENLRHPNAGFVTPEEWMRNFVPPGCALPGPGAVSAWVAGVPAPQGSKRALGAGRPGGRIRMVESSTRVKPWREDVRQAFLDLRRESADDVSTWWHPLAGPVVVKIVFVMPRTKAMRSKPSADFPMVQKPDVDKLGRAVLDALTSAGVFADDSQAVALHSFKRRAEPGEPTGAMIHVEPYQPASAFPLTSGPVREPVREPVPEWLPVRHKVSCPARVRNVACMCGAEPPAPDTPETVKAKMRGVGAFLDAAKRHGFIS